MDMLIDYFLFKVHKYIYLYIHIYIDIFHKDGIQKRAKSRMST